MKQFNIKSIGEVFCIIMITLAVIIAIVGLLYNDNRTTTSPVESNKIDSITKENNKLIIEVENLDSIKNAKVIEVKSLDNDSTLKLFYQLISK